MAEDGGCKRYVVQIMNEEYKAPGELKSGLSNRRLGTNANKCLYEVVILPTWL